MSNISVNKYIEHPLVRAYLRDLDAALRGVSAGEAGLIRESVREHFVSEFALAVAIKGVSPRQRTILIVVNVIVLVVALVYLIVALTTAAALFGPVQGGS